MNTLYFRWASPLGLRLRLLLGAKQFRVQEMPCPLQDHSTAFDLGHADLPLLVLEDGSVFAADFSALRAVDQRLPGPTLFEEERDLAEWEAFCRWREEIGAMLDRLITPVLPVFPEISADPEDLAYFRQESERRFGQSPESLANDRYGGYQQLEPRARLRPLAKLLARQRFYRGTLSLFDIVLTADLQWLRLLDGVTLPLDLQYYFQRVAENCHVDLNDGTQARP